jgi:ketosteroid isomerase-like protein
MDATTVRSMLEQHFEQAHKGDSEKAHAMYHEDAVLEFPQSGERFVGVENLRGWRGSYPAEIAFGFREVRGQGELWVAELTVTYDGGVENYGVSIIELRGERIARETVYVTEAFEAPEWRASWRAAP